MRILLATALTGSLLLGAIVSTSSPASAQGTCYSLWYERNEIYARNGYCFKTARAREVFGAGCFPPYGRLTGWEARRVRDLQAQEDAIGCPR